MIPNDPVMLLSFINLKLRDFYGSLDALCEDLDVDRKSEFLKAKAESVSSVQDAELNSLRRPDVIFLQEVSSYLPGSCIVCLNHHMFRLKHIPRWIAFPGTFFYNILTGLLKVHHHLHGYQG